MISRLEALGACNIVILDNASTYPPLLQYYNETTHPVVRLGRNCGITALWQNREIFREYCSSYYVYTDPDVIPIEECPQDFLYHFAQILMEYDHLDKAGFGLCIQDLPDKYELKQEVIAHESQYWQQPLGELGYAAVIDTTFALYRPYAEGRYQLPAFRAKYPYLARHMPWYADSEHPTDEDVYYAKCVAPGTHWGHRAGSGSSRFILDEFKGAFTIRDLIAALTADGIEAPKAPSEIESLNTLLSGSVLHSRFPHVSIPKDAECLIERESTLNPEERMELNRFILEAAYPLRCPKKTGG